MPPALRTLPLALTPLLGAFAAAQTPPPAAAAPPPTAKPEAGKQEAAKPWRLTDRLGTAPTFKLSGEQHSRYETLDNQFRAGSTLGDSEDVLALRTLLLAELQLTGVGFGLEVIDSRQYGTDPTSFVDTTMVNTADVLQAYGDLDLGQNALGQHRLRLGREAVDLGNRRLMARNAYRNTINNFTGIDYLVRGQGGDSLRAFWTLPVDRRPNDFDALRDNDWQEDDQDLDLQFWGAYYDRRLDERTNVEAYLFGLHEQGRNTRGRELYTPGFRLNRAAKRGDTHFEWEGTAQFGTSRTSNTGANLDHRAFFTHLSAGYTFDAAWQPAVTIAYDYASGDEDPNDGENNRFDTLYGARRFEYGPTGIWGAVPRANLDSPELRFTVRPRSNVELMAAWRGVWLAEARDTWTAAGVRDASGGSGRHVGEQLEARLRWDALPRNLRLEVGAAYLVAGSFQDRAPNGQGRDSSYGYVEMTWFF